MGIPASGKTSTVTGIGIDRFEDGKIVEVWGNWDTLGMLQQIGAIPEPQAGPGLGRSRLGRAASARRPAARGCRRRSCGRPRAPRRRSAACARPRPRAASRGRCSGAPSAAAATCFTQTSKPTVALPSGRFSNERIEAVRSIIAIIPGVESTRTPIVPPTSVTSRSSTVNSSERSMPGSRLTRGRGGGCSAAGGSAGRGVASTRSMRPRRGPTPRRGRPSPARARAGPARRSRAAPRPDRVEGVEARLLPDPVGRAGGPEPGGDAPNAAGVNGGSSRLPAARRNADSSASA